jgi:hypothetical protein
MTTEPTRPPVGTSASADYDRLLTRRPPSPIGSPNSANGEFPKGLMGPRRRHGETVWPARRLRPDVREGEHAPENQ